MHRLWLIFAQAVAIAVAALFVLDTLKPGWLDGISARSTVVTVTEAPRGVANDAPAPSSYAQAAARSMPAVVHVFTRSVANVPAHPLFDEPLFRRFFGLPPSSGAPQRETSGLGSGVIVSSEGFILTNNHVIEGADSIQVSFHDGRKFPAILVGRDPESDLAVLRIEAAGELPAITFAQDEQLAIGDVVLAIGNPFGVGQTVTMGIVSALGRSQLGINTFEDYIQTDAAINPGNSGGALVDSVGNLIGINTAIYSRTGGSLGIGFAIPARLARNVFDQIVENGQVTRGWIGVELQALTPELASSFGHDGKLSGVIVADILRGSPADRGGLRPGDILTRIDAHELHSARSTLDVITNLKPGHNANITLWRGGRETDTTVEVGRRPAPVSGR